jgi:predicted kinase
MKHLKLFENFKDSKKKMVLIIGLPGSGKSHLMKNINDGSFIEFDDPEEIEFDEESNDFSKSWDKIKKVLLEGKNIIINSGDFIQPHGENLISFFQDLGKTYDYSIRTIYFENNPEQCIKNIEKRGFRMFDNDAMYYASKNYKIPVGAEIIQVYR